MSKPGNQMLTAAVALLALASPLVHALDASNATRYASVDPAAFRQSAPPANATTSASNGKAQVQKKPKATKTKILTGLNNFRSPARRALDRVKSSERNCGVGAIACPAALRNGQDQSQPWSYAALRRPSSEFSEASPANAATDNGTAIVRPNADVLGLIPGRESSYKLSLSLPLGRYENVLLQANVRKNVFNTENTSDSTLRADWSLRF